MHLLRRGKPYIHPNPYFLCVGSFKRGKNIPTLIRAFGTFTRHTKTPTDLILVGSSYWQDPAIVDAIQSEKIGDHVIIKGYVKDKDLAPLYRGAIAFVCPSLVEGFGIPFTEAMASGIPVIGSSIPVLKEVVGDAGVLVDPHDTCTCRCDGKNNEWKNSSRDPYQTRESTSQKNIHGTRWQR